MSSSRDAIDRDRAARYASVRGFLTKPLERSDAARLAALISA